MKKSFRFNQTLPAPEQQISGKATVMPIGDARMSLFFLRCAISYFYK
jgi:hypothetical protein